jgi:SAM-dependent methyltransferase
MIEIRHTRETQAAYDQIYTGEAIHQMDSFFIWVCELLQVNRGARLLDIATGRGQMVEFARLRSVESIGIDFSWVACQRAGTRAPGGAINADAQRLPFASTSFDFATNIGSLEHFEQMDIAVQEMARVLKPGGKALLTVPNSFGLRWNVQYAWRTGDVDDDGQPLQRYGSRRQWECLLQANGLKVERVLGYEHERAAPRTRRDMLNYLRHPRRLLSFLLVTRFIPVNMAGQFVFICTPETRL